jgi:hypothetical protein
MRMYFIGFKSKPNFLGGVPSECGKRGSTRILGETVSPKHIQARQPELR